MTDEEKKAVEIKEAEAAAARKAEEDAAEKSESEVLEEQLAAKDAEIAKLTEEKDNYKRGMLKAKGKPAKDEEEDEDADEDIDTKIDRKVNERLLDTKISNAQADKDELLKKALARNKELETAIKNRSQISTSGQGSGSESKLTPKDAILSEEKIKQFKGMGWDDAKIERYKQNLMKNK